MLKFKKNLKVDENQIILIELDILNDVLLNI